MLLGNEPNPFSGLTVIRYSMTEAAHVQLDVHDMQGKLVAMLVYEEKRVREHQIGFAAASVPTGTYSYTLAVGHDEPVSGTLIVVR